MLSHQIKVVQALASAFTEGGRGMARQVRLFPSSLSKHSSCMNTKVHHFVVVYAKF